MRCLATSPFDIRLEWNHAPPATLQGIQLSYSVYVTHNSVTWTETDLPPTRTSHYVSNLIPYHFYEFSITASTSQGEGPKRVGDGGPDKYICRTFATGTECFYTNYYKYFYDKTISICKINK